MGEPWMACAPMAATPGLPAPMVAAIARAEAREDRAEARLAGERAAARAEQREGYLHEWMVQRANMLAREGRGFDMSDPASLAMSMDEMAERVFGAEDKAIARAELRARIDRGEVHVLNIPASELSAPPPSPEELETQRADLRIQQARYKTDHQRVVSRIRLWRKAKKVKP